MQKIQMGQKIQTALCIALGLFCSAVQVRAQVNATGTFSGLVTDPTGAAIGGAQVKVTNQGTGIVITKQTAQDGYYTVPLLKPGVYTIEVGATGFAAAVRKDVGLQIQQVVQEDFKLQVGNMQPGGHGGRRGAAVEHRIDRGGQRSLGTFGAATAA
jgi:hypothetical protein